MNLRLDREAVPPRELKSRVMASMEAAGSIRAGRRRRPFVGRAMLGLLILGSFLGGLLLGRSESTDEALPAGHSRFVLLLYEDASFRPEGSDEELLGEYAAWAQRPGESGVVLAGAQLSDERYLVDASATSATGREPSGGAVTGFFMVSAASRERALALARSSPHVQYGGSVVVRPIEQ